MVSGGWRELSAVRGSAVTVSALVHFSDSGTPLDPGVRSVLEGLFAVDLSGIRLHVGPRTDALLRAWGYPAATSGYRVLMPARRRGGSERWLRILAHEIVHAIQQAQGIAQAGGFWERHAEAAAMAVTSGRAYPDQGLAPPGRGHGAAVLAGFNSWEHRLLGDVPRADLVRIATRMAGWQDVIAQQIRLMRLWQDGGAGVTGQSIRAITPGIGLVTLPGSRCLATYGEINAVADYAASAEAVNTLPGEIHVRVLAADTAGEPQLPQRLARDPAPEPGLRRRGHALRGRKRVRRRGRDQAHRHVYVAARREPLPGPAGAKRVPLRAVRLATLAAGAYRRP